MRRLLAMLALAIGAALQAAVPGGSIDDFIDSEMAASGVPGLAYAVVADGEIAAGARGVAEAGGDEEVTPDTPFLLGSISKSFTALAVMQLVEAGEIDLDTQISDYLPAFAGQPAGAITIRQLLSHTSGYSTFQGNEAPRDGSGERDALARRVDRAAQETPAYAPGARWEYSNVNYQILGRLIEVVSGQDFQAYVEGHILQPIGMAHSFVSDGQVHEAMATGHRPWFGSKRPMGRIRPARGAAPQGGIVASANDLARYMAVMMNGKDDVLSARGKAEMMHPASEISPFYGFGWFIDAQSGSVWHSGTSTGFETLATMIPAQGKGVVVLVNAGSGTGFGDTAQLRDGITARALGLDYDGEPSRFWQKVLFVTLVLLPIGYLLSMAWAWRHRTALRAKRGSGAFGLFSLWFPLLTTIGAAVFVFGLLPEIIGTSIGNLRMYQPDLGLTLIATAVTGVLWAAFRLGVAYTGRRAGE